MNLAPPIAPDTVPFWEGAAAGKLLIKHCNACGENYYFTRPLCPFCMSADTAWLECSGDGVIYTYTVLRRGPAPAFITLAEGPTIMSAIVDSDPSTLAVGQPVKAAFRALAEGRPPVPLFVVV